MADTLTQETTHSEIKQRLEELQKEIAEKVREQRELLKEHAGEVVADYELRGQEGPARLSELFGDKDEMVLVHNMGKSCSYCTLWADGFNGVVPHLENRAAFVVVSPDPVETQKEFAEGRGWRFAMYSSQGSTFANDLGFEKERNGKAFPLPGVSTFRREQDGTIRRIASDSFGPGDLYAGIWHLFDLLPEGPNGWHPKYTYEKGSE